MRDKLKFLVLIGLCMIIFTACGKESKFNEKQKTILADYIAQTVIKHSEGYETKLVDVSDSPFLLKEEENGGYFASNDNEDKSSNKEDKSSDSEDTSSNDEVISGYNDDKMSSDNEENVIKTGDSGAKDKELATILGFKDGIEAYVSNNKVLKEYASSSYVISAEKDKKIIEVSLKITNKTNSDIKVKSLGDKIKYKLKIKEKSYYPLLTAIDNDLVYFEKKIKAKKSTSAVLLFSIPKDITKEELVIEIEGKDTSASFSLN